MLNLWQIVAVTLSLCVIIEASRFERVAKNETEVYSTLDEPKLIFAHVIFRHGDRNPLVTFPNDPWKNASFWPDGFGALTTIGMEQEYELGAYLRKRYASLLGDGHYSSEVVYVQSTDVNRTLMSAAANMAGLFPPKDNQVWKKGFMWQPVPIHSIPQNMDYILYTGKTCQRYDHAKNEYLQSSEHTDLLLKYKNLFTYLEEHSGAEIRSFENVEQLYNTLWIQNLKNKGIPHWAEEEFVEKGDFEWVANHYFQIETNTTLLARLKSGFLIRQMLEDFEQKIDGTLWPDLSLMRMISDLTVNYLEPIECRFFSL